MRLVGLALALGLLAAGLLTAAAAWAHDVRPAFLQIDQAGPDRYTVIWRTPLLSGMPLPVVLTFPEDVRTITGPGTQDLPGSTLERRVIEAPSGLAGRRIDFVGLQATITDVLVRTTLDRRTTTAMVRPSRPWIEIAAGQGPLAVATTYLRHGVEHILFGLDHLLFVASLMLIVCDWRVHDHRLHRRPFDHARVGDLRPRHPAAAAGRGDDRPQHPARLRRGRTAPAWRDQPRHHLALARRLRLRPPARLRLRRGAGRSRAASGRPAPGAPLLQRRGRDRPARLHRRHPRRGRRASPHPPLPRHAPVAAAYAIGITAAFWGFERLDAMFL